MAKLVYPPGDDRNQEDKSYNYKFSLCPNPCLAYGVKKQEICKGGQESRESTDAVVESFSLLSADGNFNYLNYLEVDPLCPTSVYTIRFQTTNVVTVEGFGVSVIGGLRYIGNDISVFIRDGIYKPREIFTLEAAGWSGNFLPEDNLVISIRKVDTGQYEKQTISFDLCPKYVGTKNMVPILNEGKCGGEHYKYTFCLCPKHNVNKCACEYNIDDMHWNIVGGADDEEWFVTWTNPDTCCTNWIKLVSYFSGDVMIEYAGSPMPGGRLGDIIRSITFSPYGIWSDNDSRWEETSVPIGDLGWICDRLRWKLMTFSNQQRYYIHGHGTLVQGVPGENIKIQGWINDTGCSNPVDFTGEWLETVGLIGGEVKEVINYETQEYKVELKGNNYNIKATDFTRYAVGDWVAVQKIGAKPPRGYPTVSRWQDEEGEWHDPVPYITDQNCPRVDPSGKIIIFISEKIILEGYYGSNFIGDPYLVNFDPNDLINATLEIFEGHASDPVQIRTIVSVRNDKVYVSQDFNPEPDGTSRFRIYSADTMDAEDLRIIPYDFKYGPVYQYQGA